MRRSFRVYLVYDVKRIDREQARPETKLSKFCGLSFLTPHKPPEFRMSLSRPP
jgi:hypothetical protein